MERTAAEIGEDNWVGAVAATGVAAELNAFENFVFWLKAWWPVVPWVVVVYMLALRWVLLTWGGY